MGILYKLLKQTITYWAPGTYDQFGDPVLGSPVQLTARWENRTEVFIDDAGDEKASRAMVYTTTPVLVGGYLYLGTSVAANPEAVSGADLIRRIEDVPSVNATETLYKAIL